LKMIFSTLAMLIEMMMSGLLFKICPICLVILQNHVISSMMMQAKSK
jgi:hypothetical protein